MCLRHDTGNGRFVNRPYERAGGLRHGSAQAKTNPPAGTRCFRPRCLFRHHLRPRPALLVVRYRRRGGYQPPALPRNRLPCRGRRPRRPVWDALRYQQNDVQEDFGGVGGIKTAGRDLLPADPSLSFRSCALLPRDRCFFSKSARFFGNSKQKNIERECIIVYNVIN